LRAGGTRLPVFFCHPNGGDTAVYRQLVHLLDNDIPVYGLDRLDDIFLIEDRVRAYIPLVRSVQPHGPYRIAGWSLGGAIAVELAQQLQALGEQVELVTMIDTIVPLANETELSEVEHLEKRFKNFKEFLESSYGKEIDLPYVKMARLDPEGQAELLADTILAEGLVDEAVSGAILRHQRTSFVDARAIELYHPKKYSGHILFFSAKDIAEGGLQDARFHRTDPARGWDEFCDDIDVVIANGHHLSLLDPPNVDHIAVRLNEVLRLADSTSTSPRGKQ